ncbi:protein regulator of cytokinesis 1-like isoform X1 [Microplitis mediator]|uniref:protein regulator of cytokinesis 1-like isoform X1 n=1 Tax=Microplitis mediator TaxID=375433 RepID=UPI002554A1C3|nr:protein regulator of cytokinesis 1-like isoform X1 [Microplitis mediator]
MSDTTGKELVDKVCKKVQVKIPVLFEIWNQCGYDERMISEYSKNVDHHIEDLLVDMVAEAEQKKSAIVQEVKIISKKIKAMEVELDMDVSVLDGHQMERLIDVVGTLKKKYKALEEIKNKRIAQCKKLLTKEAKICDALGIQPLGFHKSVPSEDEMTAFEENLAKQEAELNAHKSSFKEMRLSIMAMMNEMKHVPSHEFERLVCHDYENFIFSTSNMKKLRELHSDVEEQLHAAKEDAKKKRQELTKLWKFLEIPEEKCQQFLEIHSGYDIPTLNALQKEIRKVQELRLQNISKFIEKLRVDIQHWWDVCKLSKEERDDFTFFNSKIFTEDMLRIHEIEIERLRQHYEENKKIYDLLEKWEETWGQMKEIQRRSEDPDRFHNRGGQLLADEKIRKACNKNLPKLVAQLNEMAAEYEKKYRKPFKISGLTITEYIEQEHEKLKNELEKLKVETAKLKDDKSNLKKTPLSASRRTPRPGMSVSRRTPGALSASRRTPSSAISLRSNTSIKRKLSDHSPFTRVTRPRITPNSENVRPAKVCGSKIRRSGQAKVARKLIPSADTASRSLRKTPNKLGNKTINVEDSTDSTKTLQQYQEFQEHLAGRDELRSTLLSETIESRRLRRKPGTPIKPSRKHSPNTPRATPSLRDPSSPKLASTPRLTPAPSINNMENNF